MRGVTDVKQAIWCGAILAAFTLASAGRASAINPKQVIHDTSSRTFNGICCFSWRDTVQVTEPTVVVPVVVTWSMVYQSQAAFFVGLSVNGGPCTFYGSGELPAYVPYRSTTFSWVIPRYDLNKGVNTFTVCGGSQVATAYGVSIYDSTLSVRIGN
jgi:hypothetical protein